ncbi:MAG: hypothetical protein QOF22_2318 [Bradyrhizobium sp.]|jgi:hypothetical protein|nr:hypothetical protein [Bradyrhizobium sp.]
MSELFRASQSIFAGMSREDLQAALRDAQHAYIELTTGRREVSVSYTQGEGAKSVTFTPSSLASLSVMISELQACLGIKRQPRRPIRFRF